MKEKEAREKEAEEKEEEKKEKRKKKRRRRGSRKEEEEAEEEQEEMPAIPTTTLRSRNDISRPIGNADLTGQIGSSRRLILLFLLLRRGFQ